MNEQSYHARVAVGHYARKLAETRGGYQTTAVLLFLWSFAADPWSERATVHVAFSQFAGIVNRPDRLRAIIRELKSVGAAKRTGSSLRGSEYSLSKPKLDELDDIARDQYTLPPRADAEEKPETKLRTRSHTDERERNAYLREHDVRRSDIRNVLADLAGVAHNDLRYKTKGPAKAAEVEAAIDWMRETGADGQTFVTVCKRVSQDPNKPADVQWLFAPRHADYLAAVIARPNARAETTETQPPPKTIGDTRNAEQLEAWLRSFVSAEEAHALVTDHGEELLALESEHFTDRLRAWQGQEERGLLATALLQENKT